MPNLLKALQRLGSTYERENAELEERLNTVVADWPRWPVHERRRAEAFAAERARLRAVHPVAAVWICLRQACRLVLSHCPIGSTLDEIQSALTAIQATALRVAEDDAYLNRLRERVHDMTCDPGHPENKGRAAEMRRQIHNAIRGMPPEDAAEIIGSLIELDSQAREWLGVEPAGHAVVETPPVRKMVTVRRAVEINNATPGQPQINHDRNVRRWIERERVRAEKPATGGPMLVHIDDVLREAHKMP